jgi:hypothetical protein
MFQFLHFFSRFIISCFNFTISATFHEKNKDFCSLTPEVCHLIFGAFLCKHIYQDLKYRNREKELIAFQCGDLKIANRRPVKRSNTMPTGDAAKSVLFQQYKRQQQQDRELVSIRLITFSAVIYGRIMIWSKKPTHLYFGSF